MEDTYRTISAISEGMFKDKGSKFIAYAFPVIKEEEVKAILARIKKEHHSARHHCYAWRIGTEDPTYRSNDDGEPSSTAGKPILSQLLKFDVTNVLLVVVRYFGGILLGTGGLIHAYRSAAAEALQQANIITKTVENEFLITFTYNEMNEVMQIVKQENLSLTDTQFELDCRLSFSVRKSEAEKITDLFHAIREVEIHKIR